MATAPAQLRKSELVRIEVHPNMDAASAAKVLMVNLYGFTAASVTIQRAGTVQLSAKAVIGAIQATFEDAADDDVFLVIGSK